MLTEPCPAAGFARLLSLLGEQRTVVIQPHDFPDHDAAASAFALGELLRLQGYTPHLLYRGVIRSHSLKSMISELEIDLKRVKNTAGGDLIKCPCIVVDGNPANTNARPVTEFLFGVVDHHGNAAAPDCPFTDIDINSGSCSALVARYWEETGILPQKNIATALLMGIEMDTDFLARRVSKLDVDALYRLFFQADWEFSAKALKTSLSIRDLPSFKTVMANSKIRGNIFFSISNTDASQEVISILADFFLRFREILVTIIIETEGKTRHVSVRSRDPHISAARIIREALKDLGSGGGHDHMAGGLIDTEAVINENELFHRFLDAVAKEQEYS
ncbi:MAG: DHH family phosphoesterase [Treponema sp.]|jgi:nanoRNase/pAp phosphatase (c-di-AMP/oligoRNAs hydrolase)|nr:DHH family phosphoesterase [Treponema sp.]